MVQLFFLKILFVFSCMRTLLLLIITFFIATELVYSQDIPFSQSVYDARKQALFDSCLRNVTNNSSMIQAKLGLPVPQSTIDYYLDRMANSGEFDFDLIEIVRVFYFTNGEYESQLLPGILSGPNWLTPNELKRVYWSENHIIMWTSSAYLLEQKYGNILIPDAKKLVEHWLDLKINYGFYEYFSSVYYPFTLSAVLNLVDFAEDPVIKQKAVLVANRLLKEVLMVSNNKGVYYQSSGRTEYAPGDINVFQSPYRSNLHNLIYMLTGFGDTPRNARAAAFLATSTLNVQEIVESWKSKEDTIYSFGHSLTQGFTINSVLGPVNKTIFQWSSGAYFHPDVATQTFSLLKDYNLWNHKEFDEFKTFKDVPIQLIPAAATVASSISTSSLNTQAKIAIFKNKTVTLNSNQNYFKGKAGFQQVPWQATAGILPVYTKSGGPTDFIGGQKLTSNSTLPYIEQKSNVALIMYRANKDLALFGFNVHDVALKFLEDNYDEVDFFGKWIVGREGDGYIAVARHCTDKVNGIYICDDQDGQVWAVVVGNADMYGSYENFKALVASAKVEEKWIFRLNKLEWDYYGMVQFDNKKIEHYWSGNILSFPQNPTTSIQYLKGDDAGFNIYPNPASDQFALVLDQSIFGEINIRVLDVTGKEVYAEKTNSSRINNATIQTSLWESGLYTIIIETKDGTMTRKLMVQN
jgi:hypothetical protein